MVPPDLGEYTVEDSKWCNAMGARRSQGLPEARRRDLNHPTWGNGGVATQDMMVGTDNFEGLAQLDRRPLQSIPTEQGVVRLPYGDVGDVSYMPSAAVLQGLKSTGSRISAISDRYFR